MMANRVGTYELTEFDRASFLSSNITNRLFFMFDMRAFKTSWSIHFALLAVKISCFRAIKTEVSSRGAGVKTCSLEYVDVRFLLIDKSFLVICKSNLRFLWLSVFV